MYIGQMVLYKQSDGERPVNNSQVHPAVITAIYLGGAVDLTVFFRGAAPEARQHVPCGHINEDAACWMSLLSDRTHDFGVQGSDEQNPEEPNG